jgi:hypothetical protein
MHQDAETNLDQAEAEILTYTVSDEALEAAAGMLGEPNLSSKHYCSVVQCFGCVVD